MKTKLLIAEIKNRLFILPKIIIMLMVLGLIFIAFIFGVGDLSSSEPIKDKVKVGIVFNMDTQYGNFFMNFIENMESTKATLEISNIPDKASGLKQMENGQIDVLVVAPETLVEDIMSGKNTPAEIFYKDEGYIEDAFISEFEKAGTMILNSSQSSVYIAYELLNDIDIKVSDEVNQKLNMRYINMALNRHDTFQEMDLKYSAGIPLNILYLSSGFLMLFLLLGTSFNSFYSEVDKKRWNSYRLEGVNGFWSSLIAIISTSVVYLIVNAIVLLVMKILNLQMSISILSVISLILINISIAAIVHMSYAIGGKIQGTLLLFIFTLVSVFIAGGIIPSELLFNMNTINSFNPSHYLLKSLGAFFNGDLEIKMILSLMINAIVLILIDTVLAERSRSI